MQALKDLEIGVMFWGGRDPVETLREVKGLGVRCGQIGIPGDMNLGANAREAWKSTLAAEQFTLVTVFAAFQGESYADVPAVQSTVGFIPPDTRAEREKRSKITGRSDAGIPDPVSVMDMPHDAGGKGVRATLTRPPRGV